MIAEPAHQLASARENWLEIAQYSESKHDWLKTFLILPGGIPSHDTFRRVFCLLDPLAFQACFSDWMTARWIDMA